MISLTIDLGATLTAVLEYALSSASVLDSTKSRRKFGRLACTKFSTVISLGNIEQRLTIF